MNRTVLAAATIVAVGTLAIPSSAAPRKPITKTYTATAYPGLLSVSDYCDTVPTTHDKHLEPFKAVAAGTIKVALSGATGDWDAMLMDSAGTRLAMSANIGTDGESYTFRIKKPGTYTLMSCNTVGGTTATVKYTFTFTR